MRIVFSILIGLIWVVSAWAAEFTIKSSAYHNNSRIPTIYTCNGDNISPPLTWENAPPNTQSFVLIFSAPQWINSEAYLWVVYNIPSSVKSLGQDIETLPEGALSITNYYDQITYRGPCPPDARLHNYVFRLYALDTVLSPVSDDIEPSKFIRKFKPHILKEATLVGFFSH